jgi:hypothetical protein
MLVDPDLEEIINGERGIMRGIDACIHAQCLVSAVALIYSAIDNLAALTRPPNQPDTNREIFVNWVSKYLEPERTLKCSAMDLYGARCGVLHNYSPYSQKLREGQAKALIYKWRNGPDPDPNRQVPLPSGAITLYLEDLRGSLAQAVRKFLEAAQLEDTVKKNVESHRRELLCYKPWSTIPPGK